MRAARPSRHRCAIYTRKSSEEGLEQDFNSLDAQRDACEAYVRSQAGEGWLALGARYDDGGCSGGTLERPGLNRLLADIRFGKIDTVVVYKVDRLTRSLSDFARIVEVFDAQAVSFVSVSQQFNTTTSMGRLTLNMLLSFAQFEREVTGERIRDKIAASKRKGMWMGGFVPLGYEAEGRTLRINDVEAETVRTLYHLYLASGEVRAVKEEADRLGLATKVRKTASGSMAGGRPLSRGYLYKLLANPLYAGRIAHKGRVYDGLHPAIVDPATWEALQTRLKQKNRARLARPRSTQPSPLAGKLFDEGGEPLTPSHAVKGGKRYRYYVSRRLDSGTAAEELQRGWRLPAREIERRLEEAVEGLLANPSALAAAAREAGTSAERIPALLDGADGWQGEPLDLVARVDLGAERLIVAIGLKGLVGNLDAVVRHTVPLQVKRRGVEMRLLLADGGSEVAARDPALVKAVSRATRWFEELASGRAGSFKEVARAEGVSDRYVSHLMPLAFLAPDIVEAILAGRQPVDLTTEKMVKQLDLPLDWAEQKALLGFS